MPQNLTKGLMGGIRMWIVERVVNYGVHVHVCVCVRACA